MTLSEYKVAKVKFDLLVDEAHDLINSFPKGDFGLVSDEVRKTDEYRLAQSKWSSAKKLSDSFYKLVSNKVKREYAMEKRKERRNI